MKVYHLHGHHNYQTDNFNNRQTNVIENLEPRFSKINTDRPLVDHKIVIIGPINLNSLRNKVTAVKALVKGKIDFCLI